VNGTNTTILLPLHATHAMPSAMAVYKAEHVIHATFSFARSVLNTLPVKSVSKTLLELLSTAIVTKGGSLMRELKHVFNVTTAVTSVQLHSKSTVQNVAMGTTSSQIVRYAREPVQLDTRRMQRLIHVLGRRLMGCFCVLTIGIRSLMTLRTA
jgi:hypothetical protein